MGSEFEVPLNDKANQYKDLLIRSLSVHHHIYKSKITYNKEKLVLRTDIKNLESIKSNHENFQITDNHLIIRCPLTTQEEKNILLFEKKIIKMMGKKLVKSECLKDYSEALNYFISHLIYIDDIPYFLCKLDRNEEDVEDIIQHIGFENKVQFTIYIYPIESCFKPNKSLFVDYKFSVVKHNTDEDMRIHDNEDELDENMGSEENKTNQTDEVDQVHAEEPNSEDKEDKEENCQEKDQKQDEENNEGTDLNLNEERQKDQNTSVTNESESNAYLETVEKIEYNEVLKLAKKELLRLKQKQDELKSLYRKYIDCSFDLVSLSESPCLSQKDKDKKDMYAKRYEEIQSELLKIIA